MDQQLIVNLFRKYLRNECSSAEIDQLVDELDRPENRTIFMDLIRQEMVTGLEIDEVVLDALPPALAESWSRILADINERPPREIKPVRLLWPRLAAAVVIGLLSLAGFWTFKAWHGNERPLVTTFKPAADLPPGGNRAILTLGNGSTIILDSAHKGALTTQGDAAVIKADSNQLVYHADAAKSSEIVYNMLSTPKGGQFQLGLPDGTKVWLNAASSIRYPTAFIGSERKVEVTGEAYFEVHKNASQPFKVSIPGKEEVEVLGTSFNVNAYPDEPEIKTTLVEGSIKVRGEPLVGVNTNKNKLSVVLKPGEQVELVAGDSANHGKGSFKTRSDVDLESVLAWKNGRFAFGGVSIQEVMRSIARWYDVQVEYQGTPTTQHFRGGISRSADVSQVFKMLETTRIVHFSIQNKKIIVMP